MTFDQAGFDLRCEWGLRGLVELAPMSGAVVIVDVLSFTTAVDIAVSRQGFVLPYGLKGDSAAEYARTMNANLASAHRSTTGFSLSPASLCALPAGYRLVLPSPNGAELAFTTGHPRVFAGCLRNATAVAAAVRRLGRRIAVIPAGEKWDNAQLRPCLEDLVGAGAILKALPGTRSPEAKIAIAAFEAAREDLPMLLRECSSGKELRDRGFDADVELAAEFDVSSTVPILRDRAFSAD